MDQPNSEGTTAVPAVAATAHAPSVNPESAKPILQVENLKMFFPVKSTEAAA